MSFHPATRSLIAATVGLALLAGCNLKTVTAPGALTGSQAGGAFTSTAAMASVTSTTEARSAAQARALAASDAALVEAASATMEQAEASASFGLMAYNPNQQAQQEFERGTFGGGYFEARGGGRTAPPPRIERQAPPPAPAPREDQGADGPQAQFGRPQQGQAGAGGQAQFGRPQQGQFGQGFDQQGQGKQPQAKRTVEQRRKADCDARDRFLKQQPAYDQDQAMIAQVLNSQGWSPNADPADTLKKSGTNTLTLGNGVTRKIAVERIVDADKPHALAFSQIDIADVLEDGASKTVHWQKSRQTDGSYVAVYHHEIVTKDGNKYVADWTKTEAADGTLTGSGTFVAYDKDGAVVSKQVLTLGGDAGSGQTITTDEPAATEPSTEPEATPTPDEAADADADV